MGGFFMKTITDRLLELDPSLKRFNEGHWGEDYHPGSGFDSFNDAGLECETGEFLYSLIRLTKAEWVLETGTHVGVGASYMGMALFDNHQGGKLHTVEFLEPLFNQAIERMGKMGLHNTVENYLMDVRDFDPGTRKYDLILLDTEPQTRFAEFVKFYPYLNPGGFIFIHDLHRHMHQIPNEEHGFAWPFGVIPLQIRALVKSGEIRPFHFSTPRGLTGFYKVSPDDFKFWVESEDK
jgi:tRNA A58 N-methylase Trm61